LHCTRALETAGDTCHVETEPIFASLANVLKNYKNIQTVPLELQKFHLDPIEVRATILARRPKGYSYLFACGFQIKLGILQVVEALVFLHHSAQIVHLNISPESIVLSPEVRESLFLFGMTDS
jgi:SCY1-like protein 2